MRPNVEVVLFVSASADDARALRGLIDDGQHVLVNLPDLAGARAVLERQRPALVVCDADIEGPGSWRDLLPDAGAPLVVVSRTTGDALWAEVLELGGADLLEKPFRAEDVYRVVAAVRSTSVISRSRFSP